MTPGYYWVRERLDDGELGPLQIAELWEFDGRWHPIGDELALCEAECVVISGPIPEPS